MIHRPEIWHDERGRTVGEWILRDGEIAPDDFKPFFTEVTLVLQTPQGDQPAMKKRIAIDAVSIEEAFTMLDGINAEQLPIMQKEFAEAVRKQHAPKIEVPSGFITQSQNGAMDHNRMKFPG